MNSHGPSRSERVLSDAVGGLPATADDVFRMEDAAQVPTYAKWPIALATGKGSHVVDVAGRRYLDLYGGHCVALLGHCAPRVVRAIRAQAERLLFYSNAVYSDVRAAAVDRLVRFAPSGLGRVFLCGSGAEANETALKIARKHTRRLRVVSMQEAFHGRTLGALGATGIERYRDPAYPIPVEHTYVPYGDTAALDAIDDTVAGVLLEPIPSMGGIRVAPRAWFEALRTRCTQTGTLLMFDEVQTGFGRTGTPFFGEQVGVVPDVITGAKGVAGGFPAAVVFVRDDLGDAVRVGELGTTFGGGPLACAAIAATVAELVEQDVPAHATRIGALLQQALVALPGVVSVTGAGLLLGVNLDRPAGPVATTLREAGVLVGTCGGDPHQIRLLPPLTLTESEARSFVPMLRAALA